MAYCDYCPCEDCQYGTKYISHAQTDNGKWICSTCFNWDLCTNVIGLHGPCEDKECVHRPKIITEWSK